MKKNFLVFSLVFCALFASVEAKAKEGKIDIDGEVYMEARAAFVKDKSEANSYHNNVVGNVEPKFSFNFSDTWSLKTQWKLSPIQDRKAYNYYIGSVFAADDYNENLGDYGLVVEELKGNYKNEDMNVFFGKFNASFGEAWKKNRRIGVFTTDFTEDYELREKLGAGVSALVEETDTVITFNLFFNDTTALSNSAINKRGRNKSSNNIAGNNNNLSSYSITASGNSFWSIENLHYNFGYSDLDVDSGAGFSNQKGYLAGLEYKIPLNGQISLSPFFEIAKINNFNGIAGKNILYTTAALKLNYSNWQLGVSNVTRDISGSGASNYNDSQMQYFVGYKFKKGISLDVSHMDIKESGKKAKIVGVATSYTYKF